MRKPTKNNFLRQTSGRLVAASLLSCISFLQISCDKDQDPEYPAPVSMIRHIVFNEPEAVYYNHPVTLDLNGDLEDDFLFTVGLFENGSYADQRFVAVSLRHSRIKLIDVDAAAYLPGYPVSDVTASDPAIWSHETGILMTQSIGNDGTKYWHGSWITSPEGYLAISFLVNDRYHYGWIKLSADPENQRILIHEFAFHQGAGYLIDTGQMK
jgi:hypothetical protein